MYVLFVLVMNLWTINANAIEYLCNRWNVLMDSGSELGPVYGEIWTNGYILQGDTTINSVQYSRLLFADGHQNQQSETWEWEYYGAIRETTNAEIFFIPSGQSKEYLLFAFNARVGDKIDNIYVMDDYVMVTNYKAWAVVKEVTDKELILDLYETVEGGSEIFRPDYIWIKGIGAKRSMFQPIPNGGMGGCVVNFLLCAYNGQTQIYTSDTGEEYGCEYWKIAMDIENISSLSSLSATKILRDGQVLIERNGKTYTITGQETR